MSRKWVMHAIFECTVCGKHWEDYQTAQASASKHARQTGHQVNGEVGYAVRYGERRGT